MPYDAKFHSHTSFSGADLVVNFNNRVIGELQQITYAIAREKAPVYTLGSADPRSFSRGKRGISGTLVFAVFDRDALYEELRQVREYRTGWHGFTAGANQLTRQNVQFWQALSLTDWDRLTSEAGNERNREVTIDNELIRRVNVPHGFETITLDQVLYADTLPPFDITMTFANEYGNSAWQKIYDAEILNEGSGVSVDSIVMERQLTFVARRISPIMMGAYISQ